MKASIRFALIVAGLGISLGAGHAFMQAPGPAGAPPAGRQGGGRPNVPPPDPTKPAKLEVSEGTTARYKVREQLAGISFPNDAVEIGRAHV